MKFKRITSIFLLFILVATVATAEIFSSQEAGFSIDLPEGFAVIENDGKDSFQFMHSQLPVNVIVKRYPLSRYSNSEVALDDVFKQLSADGSHQNNEWRNVESRLGTFSFGGNKKNRAYSGWALSVNLPLENGILVVLVYTETSFAEKMNQFEVSILDSVCIDHGSYFEAGPVTSYAFPKEEPLPVTLNIGGVEINTFIDKSDEEANKFVIEREFAILKMYTSSEMVYDAWKRYYKTIYRDSYGRFKTAAFDIFNALYPVAMKNNPENPDRELAQMLLTWVQHFEYMRDHTSSDFAPLPSVFLNKGSDCDSRAMLLSVLMSRMNYETMLFISPEYSHAYFGINVEGKGAHIKVGDVNYLLGETTAKVDIGLVPQNMSEISKWMSVLD